MICGADDEARYDLARKTIRKAPEIQAFRRVRISTVTLSIKNGGRCDRRRKIIYF